MDIRMINHRITTPGMQDAEEAKLAATQAARRGRHITQRLGCGANQRSVAVALVREQRHPQFLRNRESHQEMMHRQ